MKIVATNKKAYHDYDILDTYEAGIALKGSEVKAVRAGRVNLKDSFVKIKDNQAWWMQGHISNLETTNAYFRHDETRPRNQGANLTSYELNEEEVPNTIIADNTGGILMQRGEVDMCIVGTDRTLSTGDVVNKIGTYLKALAAKDNNVPFYVALPSSTIDWETTDLKNIPIEERNSEELSHAEGLDENNQLKRIRIYPQKSKVMNLAFDVTPAKYVTGLITEKGICEASEKGLKGFFK